MKVAQEIRSRRKEKAAFFNERSRKTRGSLNAKAHVEPPPHANATVAVVGLGYVGLPLALAAEEKGYTLVGFDIDTAKVGALRRREADFLSPHETEAFGESNMQIVSGEAILAEADVVIICVPTPVNEENLPDINPLRSACMIVARNMKRGALVIVESTVNPGCCESIAIPVIESVSGLTAGKDFFFAHCPERVNPGDPYYNVRNIPRVVGGITEESADKAVSFYRSIVSAEVLPMHSIKEAEAVKMVENSFRDINIAFVNELAMAFDKARIDILNVIRGASTKPFGFMPHYPGCGVGGHCIPVDPYYLITYGRENGFTHRLLLAARSINRAMPHYAIKLLSRGLREKGKKIRGSVIALLGISYKRNIGDTRESPALVIRNNLVKRGATVRGFDPHVPALSMAKNVEEALRGADAVIVATDHDEFLTLTPRTLLECGVSVVVDGKNCLQKELFIREGISYHGIGR